MIKALVQDSRCELFPYEVVLFDEYDYFRGLFFFNRLDEARSFARLVMKGYCQCLLSFGGVYNERL